MTQSIKDFESAIAELEKIVKQLEDGDLALDKSLALFERGIELSRYCHDQLGAAQRRIEVLSERGQLWLDMIGTLCFLIPSCLLLAYLSWPFFLQAYEVGEISSNAGGLVRWPIKAVVPVGFVFLALQGASEVIKRIAALKGYVVIDAKYERPTQ